MSLWMQSATDALANNDYQFIRENLIPHAPFTIPACMFREFEFGERRCHDIEKDKLFPIRFMYLFEAFEQRNWGIPPGDRSLYNPEKLLAVWEKILADPAYLKECEDHGMRFDLEEKALEFLCGWIYIGNTFIDDFLELENTAGVELLFCTETPDEFLPAFVEEKKKRTGQSAAP